MSESFYQLSLIIHGNVQGVSFRWFTQRAAREVGVVGWVRNKPNGTVEALAEGSKEILEKFKGQCAQGPAWGIVVKVSETWKTISEKRFTDFIITY